VVEDSELRHRIMVASHNDPNRRVVLRADGNARHKQVVKVLDTLQQLGMVKVGIATIPAGSGTR